MFVQFRPPSPQPQIVTNIYSVMVPLYDTPLNKKQCCTSGPKYLRTFQPIHVLFNVLKPTGHVMHQQFNIQQLYVLPTLYVFCIYLRTNSELCHLQHKLIGFYNRDEKSLLRGTN